MTSEFGPAAPYDAPDGAAPGDPAGSVRGRELADRQVQIMCSVSLPLAFVAALSAILPTERA